jgi:hypothetical protein
LASSFCSLARPFIRETALIGRLGHHSGWLERLRPIHLQLESYRTSSDQWVISTAILNVRHRRHLEWLAHRWRYYGPHTVCLFGCISCSTVRRELKSARLSTLTFVICLVLKYVTNLCRSKRLLNSAFVSLVKMRHGPSSLSTRQWLVNLSGRGADRLRLLVRRR